MQEKTGRNDLRLRDRSGKNSYLGDLNADRLGSDT